MQARFFTPSSELLVLSGKHSGSSALSRWWLRYNFPFISVSVILCENSVKKRNFCKYGVAYPCFHSGTVSDQWTFCSKPNWTVGCVQVAYQLTISIIWQKNFQRDLLRIVFLLQSAVARTPALWRCFTEDKRLTWCSNGHDFVFER